VTASSTARVGRPSMQLYTDVTETTKKDVSTVCWPDPSPKVTFRLIYPRRRK